MFRDGNFTAAQSPVKQNSMISIGYDAARRNHRVTDIQRNTLRINHLGKSVTFTVTRENSGQKKGAQWTPRMVIFRSCSVGVDVPRPCVHQVTAPVE